MALALALLIGGDHALMASLARASSSSPSVEPDYGQVIVHARGNISLDEKNQLLAEGEKRSAGVPRARDRLYSRVGEQPRGSSEITEDTIGVDPVRVRRLADARACAHDHGYDPQ